MARTNLLATPHGRLAAFTLLYVGEGLPQGFVATAVALEIGPRRAHQIRSVLDGHELAVEDAAGRIVDVDEQDAAGTSSLEPVVVRTVELDEHAHAAPPLPPCPMLAAAMVRFPKLGQDHQLTHGLGPELDAVVLAELFLGKGRAEVFPQGVMQCAQSPLQYLAVEMVVRGAPAQAMEDAAVAFFTDSDAQPTDLALA